MARARRFLRDALGIALSQYLARAMLFARGLASALALGPHGYGGWNALNLIFDYGAYASCGAIQGLDLKLPAAAAADRERARRLMAGAWGVTLAGGAAFGAGIVLYVVAGGRAFSSLAGPGPPLLMLAAALLQLAFQYLASALRAFGRFPAVSAGHAIQAVCGGGLGIGLVWPFGVWGLLGGWLVGTLLALAWMRRAAPEAPLAPASPATGWMLAGTGLPIFGFFAASLVLRSVDRLALVRFADPEALGLYALGLMAVGLVLYLPEAAAYVLFPRVAAAFHGDGDRGRALDEAWRVQRVLALVIPIVVAQGMVWAEPVVATLLPDYRGGVTALRALAVGAMMLSAATVPGYCLLAAGRQRALLGIGAAAALVNAALVLAAAVGDPRPGRVAAAAAAGYALFAAAVLWRAAREWRGAARSRLGFGLASLGPAAWAGGAALAACAVGADGGWSAAAWRAAAVALACAPVVAWLGPGTGLRDVARAWRRS